MLGVGALLIVILAHQNHSLNMFFKPIIKLNLFSCNNSNCSCRLSFSNIKLDSTDELAKMNIEKKTVDSIII